MMQQCSGRHAAPGNPLALQQGRAVPVLPPASRQHMHRRRQQQICAAAGADGPDSKDVERLFRSTVQQPAAGSDYGEGFVEFRIGAQPLHLDVETLNERLKLRGANRMRSVMRPDEAHACIFQWENVLADTRQLQRRAWQQVAQQQGMPWPAIEPNIFSVRPERAITEVLGWTQDWGEAQRIAWDVAAAYSEGFAGLAEPEAGVREWLHALHSSNVPCALITTMDRGSLTAALHRMGLSGAFRALVTAEDGTETRAQSFLSAAIKLERPPDACVVFESSPAGLIAAHNCSMKAVAVQGPHPGYQLRTADLTVASMAELSVYNVRRLFSNRGTEFMSRKLDYVGIDQPRRKARSLNAVLDP